MAIVIVPIVFVVIGLLMSVHWALKSKSPIQWLCVLLSASLGAVAILLLVRMALGAWPGAAFMFAGASLFITGIQAAHYRLQSGL
jgi:hypothetical protein